ncbi:MAG TPA: DUF5652 family protein [Candidatus Saccharimonadia bacterium]|nr:DUF5652 family protein [Candidatus Saccharimonadia bacterium]
MFSVSQSGQYYPALFYFTEFIVAAILLELVLKGFALWRAGRNNQSVWFIVLLVCNTVGILPLIYLLFFQRRVDARATKR